MTLGEGVVSYERGIPVHASWQGETRHSPGRRALLQYRGTSLINKRHPVGPCLGSYGGPRGGAVSYERGTSVKNKTLISRASAPRASRDPRDFMTKHLQFVNLCQENLPYKTFFVSNIEISM